MSVREKTNDILEVNTLIELDAAFNPVASSKDLTWQGFHLDRVFLTDNYETAANASYARHVICIPITGSFKNDVSVPGTRRTERYERGEGHLLPAQHYFYAHSTKRLDLVQIGFDDVLLTRAAEDLTAGDSHKIELVPQLKLKDAFITDAARYLLAEVESGGLCGKLYSQSIATAIAVRLIKLYSAAPPQIRRYKGGLAKYKLRLTVEFINEHLGESISLSTLAALCDLSDYHFARAFKQSTGFAPHQFVNRQRIEQAKNLLLETNLTVAEIAFRLGFADQSHFTKIFRRCVGVTPTVFQSQTR